MHLPALFVVGASHRSAPFWFRERLAVGSAEPALAAAIEAAAGIEEFVILETCNRAEVYGVAREGEAVGAVVQALCRTRRVQPEQFRKYGFALEGLAAVEHLLEVASGLDSQVVGETEVFGQVKRAYAAASGAGSAGPVLNRLFQRAFQAAKHARTTGGFVAGRMSLASVASELAEGAAGSLGAARVLLVGAGELGARLGRAFASRGVAGLSVCSRTSSHAQALANELGAGVVAFEDLARVLPDWDIIACSTTAPGPVLSAGTVWAAAARRAGRPVVIFDLALPRDVEPAAAAAPGVLLYNLEDVTLVGARNRAVKTSEAERCRRELASRSSSLWRQLGAVLVRQPRALGVFAEAQTGG